MQGSGSSINALENEIQALQSKQRNSHWSWQLAVKKRSIMEARLVQAQHALDAARMHENELQSTHCEITKELNQKQQFFLSLVWSPEVQ
jgi:hypothetical protein